MARLRKYKVKLRKSNITKENVREMLQKLQNPKLTLYITEIDVSRAQAPKATTPHYRDKDEDYPDAHAHARFYVYQATYLMHEEDKKVKTLLDDMNIEYYEIRLRGLKALFYRTPLLVIKGDKV